MMIEMMSFFKLPGAKRKSGGQIEIRAVIGPQDYILHFTLAYHLSFLRAVIYLRTRWRFLLHSVTDPLTSSCRSEGLDQQKA
jgi:hypothetical protein